MFLCHLLGEHLKMSKRIGHLKTMINFLHLQVRQKTVLVEKYNSVKNRTFIHKVQWVFCRSVQQIAMVMLLYKRMKSSKGNRLKFCSRGRSGYLLCIGIYTIASILLAAKLNAYVSYSVPYFLRKAEIFLTPFNLIRDQKYWKEHKHLISICFISPKQKTSSLTL